MLNFKETEIQALINTCKGENISIKKELIDIFTKDPIIKTHHFSPIKNIDSILFGCWIVVYKEQGFILKDMGNEYWSYVCTVEECLEEVKKICENNLPINNLTNKILLHLNRYKKCVVKTRHVTTNDIKKCDSVEILYDKAMRDMHNNTIVLENTEGIATGIIEMEDVVSYAVDKTNDCVFIIKHKEQEELVMKNNDFTKSNLQTGDIVVTKSVGNAMIIAGRLKPTKYFNNRDGISDLGRYNNDLTHPEDDIFDIIAVYKIIDCYDYSLEDIINKLPKGKVELIWERQKKEIDWSKVPKFTKVQVRDNDNQEWFNRYFIKEDKSLKYKYLVTKCDNFSYTEEDTVQYNQIRLYDETNIKEEWYK